MLANNFRFLVFTIGLLYTFEFLMIILYTLPGWNESSDMDRCFHVHCDSNNDNSGFSHGLCGVWWYITSMENKQRRRQAGYLQVNNSYTF